MPPILPYEIFLKIIEELAHEAKLALKPTRLNVLFLFRSCPEIDAYHFLVIPQNYASDHMERHGLIQNISQIDKRSRAIVLSIISLRPFDMVFDGLELGDIRSFIRTGWVCPGLDIFRVLTSSESKLYDMLNLRTFSAADAAAIDCMRFVKVSAGTDRIFPERAKPLALLPKLEGFILQLDVPALASSPRHRTRSYREIRPLSDCSALNGVVFQQFVNLARLSTRFDGSKPIYKLLMERNIKTFTEQGSEVIRIDPALLYEDRFRTALS